MVLAREVLQKVKILLTEDGETKYSPAPGTKNKRTLPELVAFVARDTHHDDNLVHVVELEIDKHDNLNEFNALDLSYPRALDLVNRVLSRLT